MKQKPFLIFKFRSMLVGSDKQRSQTFNDSPGVTRAGKIIRRCKIDELPQIFNILLGDMSLVGPRPSLPDLITQIDPKYHRRYSIRPGLTGLAQINGSVFIDWEERCKFDLEYIDTLSFANDLRILLKTTLVVLLGEDRFAGTS